MLIIKGAAAVPVCLKSKEIRFSIFLSLRTSVISTVFCIVTAIPSAYFIFKTEKEADKACESGVLGNEGWFYGKKAFKKALEQYEKDMGYKNEIFWLDEK